MDTLRQTLIDRQAAEHWSDREMSRQLGLGIATWTRVRNGSRGMGAHVLRQIMRRFPEYGALVMLFFLTSDASNRSEVAPVGDERRAA